MNIIQPKHLTKTAYATDGMVLLFLLGLICPLLVWSLNRYEPPSSIYHPYEVYGVILLLILISLVGRVAIVHIMNAGDQRLLLLWKPLLLLDLTAPLYLVAGVLLGIPAAILAALLTQVIMQGYTLLRNLTSWAAALKQMAFTALLVLIGDTLYLRFAGPFLSFDTTGRFTPFIESKAFPGAILASCAMALLLVVVSLLLQAWGSGAWRSFARQTSRQAPVLRVQLLILSAGLLLPLVDMFDNIEGDLAWALFLVPLFTACLFTVMSTCLRIRTDEWRLALQELDTVHRRQDELCMYITSLHTIQEQERRALARTLHDETIQTFSALSLGLERLKQLMSNDNLPHEELNWADRLQGQATRGLSQVRSLCQQLRPFVLDDFGLKAALERLCHVRHPPEVFCTFTCVGTPRPLPGETETALFRIVEEALRLWQPTSTTHLSVVLAYLPGSTHLTISDTSSDPASQPDEEDLGITLVRERARLIGASFLLTTSSQHGKMMIVSLPSQTPNCSVC